MSTAPLIDGFVQFTREAMRGADQQVREAVRYRWLLGEITELLKATHGLVVTELDEIGAASTVGEAREAVDRLRGPALANTFRAQGMCDAFNALGDALSSVNYRTRGEGSAPTALREQLPNADAFAAVLSHREDRVAYEYGQQIGELRNLIWNDTGGDDLAEIKRRAASARRVLIGQISDFDTLSRQFKKLK